MLGGTGDDQFSGSNGDDSLRARVGNDTGFGEAGEDTLLIEAGGGEFFGGSDDDTFRVLTGFDGGALLDGGTGEDELRLDSTLTVTILVATLGDDTTDRSITYDGFTAATIIRNFESAFVFQVGATLRGSNNGEFLLSSAFGQTIEGRGGDDTISGRAGDDTLDGDTGNDLIIASVNFSLDENFGTDAIENLTLIGPALIGRGDGLNNVLTGNDLSNTLEGFGGDDTLLGGDGDDTLGGQNGDDTILDGDDFAEGGVGNDRFVVGAGVDRLFGNTGNDSFVITGGTSIVGESTPDGGDGADGIVFSTNGDVAYSLNTGGFTFQRDEGGGAMFMDTGTLTSFGIENFVGGDGNNTLAGDAAANRLSGSGGDDVLVGIGGNDTLDGGAGDDTYFIDADTYTVVERANAGFDTVISSVSFSLDGTNVENLTLTGSATGGIANALDNVITGTSSGGLLFGGAGNDVLEGDWLMIACLAVMASISFKRTMAMIWSLVETAAT